MPDVDTNGREASPCFKLFGAVIASDGSRQTKRPSPAPADESEKDETAAPSKGTAALTCPRCKSRETKFCYFNNYNVNQPRHFCKACHRYWTAGGALRNVPAAGDRRRNRLFSRATSGGGSDELAGVDLWILRHDPSPAAAAKMSNSAGVAR